MVRDYSKFKQSEFLKDLSSSLEPLKRIKNGENSNNIFQNFLSILNKVVDRHVPLRECTKKDDRRRDNPWITEGIIKSISTKFKLYSKKLKCNSPENDRIYKKYRNHLNRLIENRKREYYKRKLSEVQSINQSIKRRLESYERNNWQKTLKKVENKANCGQRW